MQVKYAPMSTNKFTDGLKRDVSILRQVKPKSNTKVFDLGFIFAKIQVLSVFLAVGVPLFRSFRCSYLFIRSSCRRFYAAKGS